MRAGVAMWLVAGAVLLGTAPAQAAARPLGVQAEDVTRHPDVELTVNVPFEVADGAVPTEAFTVTENGAPRPAEVTVLRGSDLEVIVVMDTTGSMQGAPLAEAKAAAGSFLDQLPEGTSVSVMAYNKDPILVSDFSADMASHVEAIQQLAAGGWTALYDTVAAGLVSFESRGPAERAMVLLTDGQDNRSSTSLAEIKVRLAASGARMFGVEYRTDSTDQGGLREMVTATDGRVVSAEDPQGLVRVYGEIAAELSNQYRITYTSSATGTTDVAVQLQTEQASAQGAATIEFPVPPPPSIDEPAPAGLQSLLANRWLWFVGAALIFLASTLMGLLLFIPGRRRINSLTTSRSRQNMPKMREGLNDLASHLTDAAEKSLGRHSFGAKLNAALERAGINLRPAEFMVLAGSIALTAVAVGTMLTNGIMGVFLGVLVIFGARMYVSFRAGRRQAKFADQLNDTLQLLAGSLRAGYGMMQAIDSVARESLSPTRDEFGRLVVEARLGRDLTTAMQAMGVRVASEDFEWVIQAIAINREVGGDLAQILDTVAGTIRERNQIRRQIKALSAEGKLSGVILTLLPVAVATLIGMTNPTYMAPLFQSLAGMAMVAFGFCLMVAGGFWMRHFINLKF